MAFTQNEERRSYQDVSCLLRGPILFYIPSEYTIKYHSVFLSHATSWSVSLRLGLYYSPRLEYDVNIISNGCYILGQRVAKCLGDASKRRARRKRPAPLFLAKTSTTKNNPPLVKQKLNKRSGHTVTPPTPPHWFGVTPQRANLASRFEWGELFPKQARACLA